MRGRDSPFCSDCNLFLHSVLCVWTLLYNDTTKMMSSVVVSHDAHHSAAALCFVATKHIRLQPWDLSQHTQG